MFDLLTQHTTTAPTILLRHRHHRPRSHQAVHHLLLLLPLRQGKAAPLPHLLDRRPHPVDHRLRHLCVSRMRNQPDGHLRHAR